MDLRSRLYAGLANENGQHVVPYTQRNAEGIVWRNPDGARAADFPAKWLKAPNRPDKLFGAFPQQAPKPAGD